MIIGERVKKVRLDHNLSQEEFGKKIGVSKVTICGYENGTRTPTMKSFLKLLSEFDLKAEYLLGHDYDVVSEEEASYKVKISKEDLKIIQHLKQYPSLYNALCADPTRMIELISRKLKK